jgi:hypothetical protein
MAKAFSLRPSPQPIGFSYRFDRPRERFGSDALEDVAAVEERRREITVQCEASPGSAASSHQEHLLEIEADRGMQFAISVPSARMNQSIGMTSAWLTTAPHTFSTPSATRLFFRQLSGPILKVPAQAGYGDKWPLQ